MGLEKHRSWTFQCEHSDLCPRIDHFRCYSHASNFIMPRKTRQRISKILVNDLHKRRNKTFIPEGNYSCRQCRLDRFNYVIKTCSKGNDVRTFLIFLFIMSSNTIIFCLLKQTPLKCQKKEMKPMLSKRISACPPSIMFLVSSTILARYPSTNPRSDVDRPSSTILSVSICNNYLSLNSP